MGSLNQSEMLALIPADTRITAKALLMIDATYDLTKLTCDGIFQTAQVDYQGKPAFHVWFRKLQDHLIIEMVVGMSKAGLECMIQGFGMIARQLGCKWVDGMTRSKGLADFYLSQGFEPVGVFFRGKVI